MTVQRVSTRELKVDLGLDGLTNRGFQLARDAAVELVPWRVEGRALVRLAEAPHHLPEMLLRRCSRCSLILIGAPNSCEAFEVDCETDASALLMARRMLTRRPQYEAFELWPNARRVHAEMRNRIEEH